MVEIVDKTKEAGFGDRFGQLSSVDGVIIHHTAGGGTVDGVISTFQERGLPAQYVIDQNGIVYQTLPDGTRGQQILGSQPGASRMGLNNSNTIGIEVIGANDAAWTPQQVAATQALVGSLTQRYGLNPQTSVWGHSEVNPRDRSNEGANLAAAIRNGTLYVAPSLAQAYAGNPFGVTGQAPVQLASLSTNGLAAATPPPNPNLRPPNLMAAYAEGSTPGYVWQPGMEPSLRLLRPAASYP